MDINKSYTQHQQKVTKKSKISNVKRRQKDTVKVVYISTPMKIKTSASKFRAIVQELTGRESDVVRIMESSGGVDTWTVSDHHQQQHYGHDHRAPPLVLDPDSMWASPSSSEEFIDPFHGLLVKAQDGFGPDSSLLYDQFCHHLDVIGAS